MQFFSMLLFQVCMFTQIFIYCWYGNMITAKVIQRNRKQMLKGSDSFYFQGERLTRSFYFSEWIECPATYKKKLLFILLHVHKPIKHYAGNMFVLSLDTFVSVSNSAFIPKRSSFMVRSYRFYVLLGPFSRYFKGCTQSELRRAELHRNLDTYSFLRNLHIRSLFVGKFYANCK